jgi:hypothetical protein
MSNNFIKYSSRTFSQYKEDMIAMIKQSYPEVLNDFTDSSVGSMLIELNAGIANNLSMNIDRVFMETQLSQAQKKSSLYDHAKRLGFNIPGKRASVSIVDFTVDVPVLGNEPNESYYPTLMSGAVVTGSGRSFETQDVIDWSSPVNSMGHHNRSIIPNLDSNGVIQSYSITKREVVINGVTKIHKRVITANDIRPFFSLSLPDNNVIGVDSVILLEGTNYASPPNISKFFDSNVRYFEVDYLAQQRIFHEVQLDSADVNQQGLKAGKWIDITKKFIKEYTPNGYCRLIFGTGDPENDNVETFLGETNITTDDFIKMYLENTALGEKLKEDHTLFIRYRVGGGVSSNVGRNTITGLGNHTLVVSGPSMNENQSVKRSLSVTNPIPAVGGRDELNVEEIRHLIKYNLASQNRCVTLNDYILRLFKMPGRFGLPFKSTAYKKHNKVIISILGLDSGGKLSNVSNSLLKKNIVEYLTEYRMINDFVEVKDGKIYNIAFDVEVFVENVSDVSVGNNIIREIDKYFNVRENEMNKDIFIGRLEEVILKVPNVINVIKIKAYNRVGGAYSNNSMSLDLVNQETDEINLKNNTLYSSIDSMFEIKFPEKDIRVFLRRINS